MSAWIVGKKNIDSLVTFLLLHPEFTQFDATAKDPDILGQKLWQMNHDAVNQLYEESTPCPKYVYESVVNSDAQVWTSARCLRYQCSEGGVIRTPLYRQLNLFIVDMAVSYGLTEVDVDNSKWE